MNLTIKEKEMVTNWIINTFNFPSEDAELSATLLYNGEDSDVYYSKFKDINIPTTLCIIKIRHYDHIICYFMSQSLRNLFIHDDNIFIAVIRSCFDHKGPQIWRIKPGESPSAVSRNEYPSNYSRRYDIIFGDEFKIKSESGTGNFNRISGVIANSAEQSRFKPKMKGNVLSGGKKFCRKFRDFQGEIECINLFQIKGIGLSKYYYKRRTNRCRKEEIATPDIYGDQQGDSEEDSDYEGQASLQYMDQDAFWKREYRAIKERTRARLPSPETPNIFGDDYDAEKVNDQYLNSLFSDQLANVTNIQIVCQSQGSKGQSRGNKKEINKNGKTCC